MNSRYSKYGALVAIIAAIFWGFSGTCSQYIFERFTIDASHLTSIRMLSAGTIVVAIGFLTETCKARHTDGSEPVQHNMNFRSVHGALPHDGKK